MALIENYDIYHKLGAGGFGSVYLARDTKTNDLVAVKILDKFDSDDAVERFYREIRTLINLNHSEYVANVFDYGIYDERPFYVMDYYPRGSLRNFIGLGNLKFAMTVLYQISSVLMELEKLGGFHRDVKPDNILVSKNLAGETIVKLSDFGLARTLDTSIFTNNAAGTDAYKSPQALANEPFETSDDVFSLGLTVVELLTGKRDRSGSIFPNEKNPKESSSELQIKKMLASNPKLRLSISAVNRFSGLAIGIRTSRLLTQRNS